MQETEEYKLKKPDADDFFDIEDFNENTDKIEQALKENAEGVQELKAPPFNDSGTVDGINSFTDFLNSVKNKMNIFQFFKNFKAGMKFILHTGMIVDNYATKEKGFIPDATLVTSLKEQLDEQNNNINFVVAAEDSLSTLEDAIKSVWEQLPRNKYFSGEVQWKGINTIHGYVYGTPIYGAVTAFSYGQPLVTVRKMDNIFYVEKPVLNSDFTYIEKTISVEADKNTGIAGAPNSKNYIPIIAYVSESPEVFVYWSNGWAIKSKSSQSITVGFYKLPS